MLMKEVIRKYSNNESNNFDKKRFMQQLHSNFLSIQKTTDKVSEKTLNEVYKPMIITNLDDKIPNVKVAKALKVLRGKKNLSRKAFNKYVEKLKTDMDC